MGKQYALQDKQDQISKEVAKAWTSLTENTRQISIAEENCKLAEENLDLNTFSYTEGKLTILDVTFCTADMDTGIYKPYPILL